MTKLLDTKDAARYLGLSESGLKYYVYRVGKIRPACYFGRSPAYSQESLDEFNENERRGPGRPRKGKEESVEYWKCHKCGGKMRPMTEKEEWKNETNDRKGRKGILG